MGNIVGNYTVTATHRDAQAMSSPFTATAVNKVTPPDDPDDEQGNGNGGGDDPNQASQTYQANSFNNKSLARCAAPENVADPINITNGNTLRMEVDYAQTGLSPLEFTRTYNSLGSKSTLMKNYWTTPYDRAVYPPSGSGQPTRLRRPDGQIIRFSLVGSNYVSDAFFHGTLQKNGTGWRYIDTNQTVEEYNSTGALTTVTDLQGRILTLTYSKGQLIKVASNTGELLTFQYNSNNQISTATDQSGRIWTYTYDGYSNLKSVKYPNGIYHLYFYVDRLSPFLLSGVYVGPSATATLADAETVWEYDAQGRATANYFPDASSPTGQLQRTDIIYGSDGTTRALSDGNGNISTYTTERVNGRGFVSSIAGPDAGTCGNNLARTFDSEMNVTSRAHVGHVTNFGNYDAKGQYAYRAVAVGTPVQRETGYSYDSRYFRKPTQIIEPSVIAGQTKLTQMTYDGYGNVTQKTVSGFRPNPISSQPPIAISRTWTYEYNGPYRQLSKIDGPRIDKADVTTFAYNTAGRLISVTDANGIARRKNISYTATGNVLSEDRPNGLRLAYSYYAGSDLLSAVTETQGTATRKTSWTYDNNNRVASITFSDGVNINQSTNFTHNRAGQLVKVSSAAGTITYSFDEQGNPITEKYTSSNQTQQVIQRTFDSYNRVNKVIGANNTIETVFHPDGTLLQSKDGKGEVTQREYDGLLRLTKVIRPDNSQIVYDYDAAGNLNGVTDPNFATTTYVHDDFGNKVQQISPDSGTTSYAYDLAGNLIQAIDAKGHITQYTYDAGNRLLTVDRAGTDDDETYAYDNCTNGVGLLCWVTSGNGEVVAYQYDGFGNIAAQTTSNKAIKYQYDAQRHVTRITYPSGRVVNYTYNAGGQVTAVSVTENGTTTTLASNITYAAMGPATGWTYGNGTPHTRQYDQQYWVRSIATPNVSNLAYSQYDLNGNLTRLAVDGTNDVFGYDLFDQLNAASGDFGSRSYEYDAIGNRTSLTADGAAVAYSYTANSNRISTQTGFTYTLDANGNTAVKRATDGSGSGVQYQYSPHNRLVGVSSLLAPAAPIANYAYNALGQRAYKLANGSQTRYHYGLDGKLLAEVDASGAVQQEYVYLNDAPLALLGVPQSGTTVSYDVSTDTTGTTSSAWTVKSDSIAVGGTYYYLDMSKAVAATQAYWNFTLPYSGYYDIYVWWMGSGETAQNYTVFDGATSFYYPAVATASATKGTWVKLGNYHFVQGTNSQLRIESQRNAVANKAYLAADAARMVLTQTDSVSNPNYRYIHTDHLGAPRAVTDWTGRVLWKATYDPFGQATVNPDVAGTGQPVTLNLRFPGQYYDAETGLHYNYFRDYEPTTGRYVESDPIGLGGGLNGYAYAKGNPLSFTDPLGLQDLGQSMSMALCSLAPPATSYPPDWSGMSIQPEPPKGPFPNGNMTGGYTRQDGVCSQPAGVVNYTTAFGCCFYHDACYAQNKCNASSWHGPLSSPCQGCNMTAAGCIITSIISGQPVPQPLPNKIGDYEIP